MTTRFPWPRQERFQDHRLARREAPVQTVGRKAGAFQRRHFARWGKCPDGTTSAARRMANNRYQRAVAERLPSTSVTRPHIGTAHLLRRTPRDPERKVIATIAEPRNGAKSRCTAHAITRIRTAGGPATTTTTTATTIRGLQVERGLC